MLKRGKKWNIKKIRIIRGGSKTNLGGDVSFNDGGEGKQSL